MICAIVLAAGRSVRMGTQKLLLPYGGTTVIGRVVDAVVGAAVERTVVVTGADHERVAEALAGRDVVLVRNPDGEGDMLSSVRCGVAAVPGECEAAMVVLGDQPSISAGLIEKLVRAYRGAGRGIAVPTYEGRRGHPVLFSRRYFGEVMTGFEGEGLRGLLLAHPEDVLEVAAATSGVLVDIDTPEDYRRAVERID
jgi:molybdenum cofactor cytidylyltransferase